MTPRNVTNKKNWSLKISQLVKKVFGFIKLAVQLFWEVIEQFLSLITFFFSFLVRVLANPATPCVVAILFFMFVCIVATLQWWAVGIWLAKAIGVGGFYGSISAGAMGVIAGFGLNAYQISPQLWKLRRDIARAYSAMGVDPEHEGDDSLKDKQKHWWSYDHATLKAGRLVSYAIETGTIIAYCAIVQHFNFVSLIQATVSLLLPEKALEMVSSTISLLGKVSEKISDPTDGDDSQPTADSRRESETRTNPEERAPKRGVQSPEERARQRGVQL